MNRTTHILTNILLGCLIAAGIIAHIKYLCWERDGFAVGGEWFVYIIALVAYLWRFCYDD